MQLVNTADRYGAVARVFHWLVALLIVTSIGLGLVADALPYESQDQLQAKAQVFSIHKSLGIAILAVALLRILWALGQPRPHALHPERRAETFLSEVVHWSLYAALVVVPLSGWIQHAASEGFAPILWPIGQSLPGVAKSPLVETVAGAAHWLFGKVLIAAVALHVLGALRHALERDGTLARMWAGHAAPRVPPRGAGTAGPALLVAAAIYVAGGVGAVWLSADGAAAPAPPGSGPAAGAGNWVVEDGTVAIAVAQFGSTVTGRFAEWQADITFDDAVAEGPAGRVRVEIAIPSLTLGSVTEQAMGPDYFDTETHPTAVFDAAIEAGESGYLAAGTLDLAGDRAQIALPVTLAIDGDRAKMSGTATLDRRDFGIGAGTTDPGTLGFKVAVAVDLVASRADEQRTQDTGEGAR